MKYTIDTDEVGKPARARKFTRSLVVAGLAATVLTLAASSSAYATKRVCYKDPGLGMVCTVVK